MCYLKVKPDNFDTKIGSCLLDYGNNAPRKWKQEEPTPGLESKLVKDYVNELEIVTYGILIYIQGYGGTESQLVWKSVYCVLK